MKELDLKHINSLPVNENPYIGRIEYGNKELEELGATNVEFIYSDMDLHESEEKYKTIALKFNYNNKTYGCYSFYNKDRKNNLIQTAFQIVNYYKTKILLDK